jgi:Leucine-rich repeat (LRR) protein
MKNFSLISLILFIFVCDVKSELDFKRDCIKNYFYCTRYSKPCSQVKFDQETGCGFYWSSPSNTNCYHLAYICKSVENSPDRFPKFSSFLVNIKVPFRIILENKNYETVSDYSFANLRIYNIEMNNNKIRFLDENAFKNITGLKELRLNNNELTTINVGYLSELEILDLENNKLTRIDQEQLRLLIGLRKLFLRNNQIDYIQRGALNHNTNLGYLDLDSNLIKTLDIDLNLPKLTVLFIRQNQISALSNKTLSGLGSLKHLHLSSNYIGYLEPGCFDQLKNIEFINFYNNILTSIKTQVFRMPTLIRLIFGRNRLRVIEPGYFNHLTSLTSLGLGSNKVHEIRPFAFAGMNAITELVLTNSMLNNLSDYEIFHGLQNLRTLRLNENILRNLFNFTFIRLANLVDLDLSRNKLEFLQVGCFSGLNKLQYLKLNDNNLKILQALQFKDLTSLRKLELQNNQLYKLEPNSFFGLEISLQELQMASNKFQFLKNTHFRGLKYLKTLNLAQNIISSIEKDTFKDLGNLNNLFLCVNSIAYLEPDHFKNLHSLTSLDLSQNVLVKLKLGTFSTLIKLLMLNLNQNFLVKVDFYELFSNKSSLNKLAKLYLANNMITEINMNSFRVLNSLTLLDLSNNPFNMKVIKQESTIYTPFLPSLSLLNLKNSPIQLIQQFDLKKLIVIDLSNCIVDFNISRSLPFKSVQNIILRNLTFMINLNLSTFIFTSFGSRLEIIDLSYNRVDFGYLNQLFLSSLYLEDLFLTNTGLSDLSFQLNIKKFVYLQKLDLSLNRIRVIPTEYFAGNTNLIHINLGHNLIQNITKGFHYIYTNEIQELDISYNMIDMIDERAFNSLHSLKILDLSHNRLKLLDQSMFGINYLFKFTKLILNDNQNLQQIDIYFFSSYFETVKLSGNDLTDLSDKMSVWTYKIEDFDCSRNKFKTIKSSFFKFIVVMSQLSFSENSIEVIEDGSFVFLVNLKRLDLSVNLITNLSSQSLNGLFDLEFLNLSYNRVEVLEKSVFINLQCLYKLDLRNNFIRFIREDSFEQMNTLRFVYLGGNLFESFFSYKTLKDLSALEYLDVPSSVEFTTQSCYILKSSTNVHKVKQVLHTVYFSTLDIMVIEANDYDLSFLPAYTNTSCLQIIYLVKNQIQLNLYTEGAVKKFLNDCRDKFGF